MSPDPSRIPVTLAGSEWKFHDPSLVRLPQWLDRLADEMSKSESTADLFDQDIQGLRNWAAVVRALLAEARPPLP
jgi:hypothetical protein